MTEREAEPISAEGWQDIATAPRDGTAFRARFRCSATGAFFKTKSTCWHRDHWCDGDDGMIEPTHWKAAPRAKA